MSAAMSVPTDQPSEELAPLLERLRSEHGVVGAQLAIDHGGAVREAAAGVLNTRLASPVTTDALFQIGSITKVWTTSILMQLVDEGVLDLDLPVMTYLPDLRSEDPDQMARVTTRDLLAHTSGIEGDVFWDTGRGDDCVARYVARFGELGFIHPVGATASYSNAGFVLAGRLVEVLTGQTWDQALEDRLIAPLGLTHTQTLPERMMPYAVAHGHVTDDQGAWTLAPRWDIPRSSGPAGIINARARDVCAFARMHLNGGLASDGSAVMSAASVAAMQVETSSAPAFGRRGLGWTLDNWSARSYSHNGGTFGQLAFLRVIPEHDLAITLLTNGGDGPAMFDDLARAALAPDVVLPAPLAPPDTAPVDVDVNAFSGTYERHGATVRLRPDGSTVLAEITQDGFTGDQASITEEHTFHPVDTRTLMAQLTGATWAEACIYEVAGTEYLHVGGRAARRIG